MPCVTALCRSCGELAAWLDTVCDVTPGNLQSDKATGFAFDEALRYALGARIREACTLYRDQTVWQVVQRRGMAQDFSWMIRLLTTKRFIVVYKSGPC